MNESEAASPQTNLDALKALQADASELERIENLLGRFNVFEAIDFVQQETTHSRFLAFLLDPKRNHGLGNLFLSSILRNASESSDRVLVPGDLDSTDTEILQTSVRTEANTGDGRIDILLLNEVGRWAVIVENKVWTTEHHDQLERYHRFVKDSHPGWRVSGLYLTPFGDTPSHEAYASLDYGSVCDIVDDLLEERGSAVINPTVRMAMEQYTDMVRRRIVGDPEVVDLCRSIYRKHQRALDLIYEHRPDTQAEIKNLLEDVIRNEPRLEWDSRAFENAILRFAARDWDAPILLKAKWTRSGRNLLFEFWNHPDRLQLKLIVGPGPDNVRRGLLEMARTNPEVFDTPRNYVASYYEIFSRTFLGKVTHEDGANLEVEIRLRWTEFLEKDLPRIEAAFKEETWI